MKLFDEDIDRSDTAPGSYAGRDFDYLNGSGRVGAQAIRLLLELWFSRYPDQAKADFRAAFRSKNNVAHTSAFFELYIHELLVVHGCKVEVHPQLPDQRSTRPDFLARKDGNDFYVEATVATNSSVDDSKAEARLNEAYDALNKIHSPNFFVGVHVYGVPSTPIPLNELRREAERFLSLLDPDAVSRVLQMGGLDSLPSKQFSHGGCTIEFFPISKSPEARGKPGLRPLGMVGPGEAYFVDDTLSLKKAIDAKRKRYGELGRPFVVAVNAVSQHLDNLDIGDALFGQESEQVSHNIDQAAQPKTSRTMKGIWLGAKGPTNTRVSAVLVTSSLNPWSVHVRRPMIVHNPWAKHSCLELLPDVTNWFPAENRMAIREGKLPQELFRLSADLVLAFSRGE